MKTKIRVRDALKRNEGRYRRGTAHCVTQVRATNVSGPLEKGKVQKGSKTKRRLRGSGGTHVHEGQVARVLQAIQKQQLLTFYDRRDEVPIVTSQHRDFASNCAVN